MTAEEKERNCDAENGFSCFSSHLFSHCYVGAFFTGTQLCQPTFQYRSNQSDNRKVLLLFGISSLLRERKLLPGHKKILFLPSLIQETRTRSPVVSALGLVVCLIPRPSAVGTISLQTYPGAFTHTSYSEEMKKE